MHVILKADKQNDQAAFPEWCNLSCFRNNRAESADIEPHYHDAAEIWVWHEGIAEGTVDGRPVALRHGVMAYTPAGCLHAFRATAPHANTGIVPHREPWMRTGRLHPEETGESPAPEIPAFWFQPRQNRPDAPAEFPAGAFLKHAYAARLPKGARVLRATLAAWAAVLVREGRIAGTVGGGTVDVAEPDLLVMNSGSAVDLRVESACEIVVVIA